QSVLLLNQICYSPVTRMGRSLTPLHPSVVIFKGLVLWHNHCAEVHPAHRCLVGVSGMSPCQKIYHLHTYLLFRASGMSGIYNWLEYLNTKFSLEFGQDWDPGGTIRAGIKNDLDMISSGKINWAQLIADGEQLGIRIESEQDFYRVQNYRSYGSGG